MDFITLRKRGLICGFTLMLLSNAEGIAGGGKASASMPSVIAPSCVLLGSEPSVIVKFKDHASSYTEKNLLSLNALQHLSIGNMSFTESRVMSGGAYILFFTINSPAPPLNLLY
jgi:hypothetical protein